jgi:hypothetical protein
MPFPLYPRGKNPWYSLCRRLGGPQSGSGCCGEDKNLALLGIEPGPSRIQEYFKVIEMLNLKTSRQINLMKSSQTTRHVNIELKTDVSEISSVFVIRVDPGGYL